MQIFLINKVIFSTSTRCIAINLEHKNCHCIKWHESLLQNHKILMCFLSWELYPLGTFPEVLKYLSQRLDREQPKSLAELTAYIDLKYYFQYKFVQELFFVILNLKTFKTEQIGIGLYSNIYSNIELEFDFKLFRTTFYSFFMSIYNLVLDYCDYSWKLSIKVIFANRKFYIEYVNVKFATSCVFDPSLAMGLVWANSCSGSDLSFFP